MKTIAQQLNWNFEKDGDLVIEIKDGWVAYRENAAGYWERSERDDRGNQIYWENANGLWERYEYTIRKEIVSTGRIEMVKSEATDQDLTPSKSMELNN